MKIIGVSTVKDEPEIGRTIRHMRDQGVDDFVISSAPDEHGVHVAMSAQPFGWTECAEPFDQGAEITKLARIAADYDADWIIPFDADEYWSGTNGRTIREELKCVDPNVDTLYARMYLHITPERRAEMAKPLPKVIFRPRADMTVAWGNHDVTGGTAPQFTPIMVRELQYASYPHFLAKIEKARHLHTQPHMADHQNGSHMWRLCNLTPSELEQEWAAHLATPTVHDPIPGSDKW